MRRRRHSREPKRQFIIYCEGRNTEPAYFNALMHAWRDALIEIETVPAAGVPYTLAQAAANRARDLRFGRRNSFEQHDQVWAVFDRDEHPNYADAVGVCNRGGVRCGRSNPCFEIWLILHQEHFDRPDDRHAVQAHLRRLRPEYDPGGRKMLNCVVLIEGLEEAEQRAERQLGRREDEGVPYGQPSTTVGCLTRAIREAAEKAR